MGRQARRRLKGCAPAAGWCGGAGSAGKRAAFIPIGLRAAVNDVFIGRRANNDGTSVGIGGGPGRRARRSVAAGAARSAPH